MFLKAMKPDIPRVASGVFIVCNTTGRHLMLNRSNDEGWCIPGGGIQYGEYPTDSALREFEEECGITRDTIRLTGKEDRTHNPDGLIFTTYCAECDKEFEPVLNDEHIGFVWGDPSKSPQPLHPGFEQYLIRNGFIR
jgi:8-oxo-dGTP pyrophosphatase MutT (NUDIX family)